MVSNIYRSLLVLVSATIVIVSHTAESNASSEASCFASPNDLFSCFGRAATVGRSKLRQGGSLLSRFRVAAYTRLVGHGVQVAFADSEPVTWLEEPESWLDARGPQIRVVHVKRELYDGLFLDLVAVGTVKRLVLTATKVTDADLRETSRLSHLVFLAVAATDVTDVGLENICGLPELEAVNLSGTRVSDECLYKLVSTLPKLRVIYLYSLGGADGKTRSTPNVSEAGLLRIERDFPAVAIER